MVLPGRGKVSTTTGGNSMTGISVGSSVGKFVSVGWTWVGASGVNPGRRQANSAKTKAKIATLRFLQQILLRIRGFYQARFLNQNLPAQPPE
jgi:hypothetical protein